MYESGVRSPLTIRNTGENNKKILLQVINRSKFFIYISIAETFF